MRETITIYWLGEPFHSLPKPFRGDLELRFEVIDCGKDIAVMSEKGIEHYFVYLTQPDHNFLKSISTLCSNLDKKIIVLFDKNEELVLPQDNICSEIYHLSSGNFPDWIESVRLKYFQGSTYNRNIDLKLEINLLHNNSNLDRVIQYVTKNVHREIKEQDVAALCHYSVTYFSKLFHRKVGISFRDFVTTKRISLAKKLLVEDSSAKIAYVAYQCGYRDVSYFSRIFKKKTGYSPAAYRQKF
ncbi:MULTISPECIES: helix-turn-helix domain-containing protein [Vibrio]|uniref:helix-turn-helix domain-containing protein n=1 Tax=Vibrio TaxID=662 RepID=UPI0005F0059F|nr:MULTISPECIES: AraC family transcriptional regulator [Vibrio]